MPNKLIRESSPYLLQHAGNPVEWNPWGDKALSRAVSEDKPVLLSIGYAACHWCHVMEQESFENPEIAATMNAHFICIKVDREERPDLDKIYQTAHQMLTQRPGGWPLTMVLSPGGHAPFFAGTYFPPVPRHGMPGFGDTLIKIAEHYQQHKGDMDGHVKSFRRALAQLNPVFNPNEAVNAADCLDQSVATLRSQFDPDNGGFGDAPKFPHPTQLELLLRHAATNHDQHEVSLAMANKTLRKMHQGGLFDQLGGGFYRYSVDQQWRIPHFEKMLYDNAQLLNLYTDGFCLTGKDFYRNAVERTAHWVISEMQRNHGGYASTLDADSEGVEGKFYVWSETDLRAILTTSEYQAVENRFGLVGEANFEGNWHLNVNEDAEPIIDSLEGVDTLPIAMDKLLQHRNDRVRPALDDKILTGWNGLMIKGMARSGRILNLPELLSSAHQSVNFLRNSLWQNGRLMASYRSQEVKLNGYLDDYAFLAEGLAELLQSEWRNGDLSFLVSVCDAMILRFEDSENGGFFFTSHDHETLLHRPKPGADDAIPSSNGAAATILYRLGELLGEPRFMESAQKIIKLFAAEVTSNPSVFASLTMAALDLSGNGKTVVVRGSRDQLVQWQKAIGGMYLPDTWVYLIPEDVSDLPSSLALKPPVAGKTVAYICQGLECKNPIETLDELLENLVAD